MAVRRRHIDTAGDDQGSALVREAWLRTDATDHDHGARDDRACRELTGISTHEQQATTHAGAGVPPHGSADDDLTAGHAARGTSQSGTDTVARVMSDMKRPTRHCNAWLITSTPSHLRLATGHPGYEARAYITIH